MAESGVVMRTGHLDALPPFHLPAFPPYCTSNQLLFFACLFCRALPNLNNISARRQPKNGFHESGFRPKSAHPLLPQNNFRPKIPLLFGKQLFDRKLLHESSVRPKSTPNSESSFRPKSRCSLKAVLAKLRHESNF